MSDGVVLSSVQNAAVFTGLPKMSCACVGPLTVSVSGYVIASVCHCVCVCVCVRCSGVVGARC